MVGRLKAERRGTVRSGARGAEPKGIVRSGACGVEQRRTVHAVRDLTPYVELSRAQWRALRAATPLRLTAEELTRLRGLNEVVSLDEVADVYLPLSRLINL